VRAIQGQPLEPFHYLDKGTLATIGRAAAVANFGRVKLSGLVAWLLWLFVHIFLLIGFRSRCRGDGVLGVDVLHVRPRRAAHHG
jgi:NADH dehydrogenase